MLFTWVHTFKGIISILQSYFTKKNLSIRVCIKAIDLPFQMSYGSLICMKRLQSDRPKCWGMLAEAGPPQKHIKKYLSVGPYSKSLYQQIALNVLFQMRYGSLVNSDIWSNGIQKGAGNPCFLLTAVLLFSLLFLLELGPPQPTYLYILICLSVTSWSR